MKATIDTHQNLLQSWKKDSSLGLQGRTIAISPSLPSLYRHYKEKTRLPLLNLSQINAEGAEIRQLITSINSTVQL
jgi:hypothetical protein